MRNHAKAIVACDFFTTVTVNFRILYVFVAMEIDSRRVLHFNVTEYWGMFRDDGPRKPLSLEDLSTEDLERLLAGEPDPSVQ